MKLYTRDNYTSASAEIKAARDSACCYNNTCESRVSDNRRMIVLVDEEKSAASGIIRGFIAGGEYRQFLSRHEANKISYLAAAASLDIKGTPLANFYEKLVEKNDPATSELLSSPVSPHALSLSLSLSPSPSPSLSLSLSSSLSHH